MRDIKFRFYDTHFKKMLTTDEMNNYEVWDCMQDDRFKNMQYTGLKDISGVEIYEGDIVSIQYDHDKPTIHEVVWCGIDYPAFDFQPQLNCECNGFSQYHNDQDTIVEVIGNIYENPKLLGDSC